VPGDIWSLVRTGSSEWAGHSNDAPPGGREDNKLLPLDPIQPVDDCRDVGAAIVRPGDWRQDVRHIHIMATAGLLLITLLVAGIAAISLRPQSSNALPNSTAAETTVRDFYAAINQSLQSRNPSDLQRHLDKGFASHDRKLAAPANAAEFTARIVGIIHAFPGSRVVAENVTGSGNLVFARIAFEGPGGGALLGLPIPAGGLWGPLDIFRVSDGKIAEHWGSAPAGLAVSQPVQAPFPVVRQSRWVLQLVEVTIASEVSLTASSRNIPVIYRVHAGQFRVTSVSAANADSVAAIAGAGGGWSLLPPGTDAAVGEGQFVVVPLGTVVTISNQSTAPAVLLELSQVQPVVGGAAQAPLLDLESARVTRKALAVSPAMTLAPGDYLLEFGQLGLPVGAGIANHSISAPRLMLVEHGQLTISTNGEKAWVTDHGSGVMRTLQAATLVPGDGVVTPADAEHLLFNTGDEPADLLVARLTTVSLST
jgi:predicted ester cyclase/mannose-6-phosphate isomerase-like protein (cupin superfamily)